MKNAVFMDTSAFVALADSTDQYHEQARQVAVDIERLGPRFTTPFILMETCLYLQRRMRAEAARRFWLALISGEAEVELVPTEDEDLERAYKIAVQYADQDFSFVDCTSFAVMERLKTAHAFSFDRDFMIFRFPVSAFRCIPLN